MFAALHVPEEQQDAPVHPWPPHCPYRAAQFPPLAGGVGELAGGVAAPPSLLPPPADEPTVIVAEPVLKYYLSEARSRQPSSGRYMETLQIIQKGLC